MVNEVSNVTMQTGGFQNPYSVDPLDLDYCMGMYNGSVFGAMPMVGGYNNQQYYDNMMNNLHFNQNYNVETQNGQRNVDLRVNASVEAVKGAAMILKDKIL